MIEQYVLKRLPNANGNINFSWRPLNDKKGGYLGPLIEWDHKWLRREAFKLKVGEEKIYEYDNYRLINIKKEKFKDFLIDVYFWLKGDWRYTLLGLKNRIKTKQQFLQLPKEDRQKLREIYKNLVVIPSYPILVNTEEVEVKPMEPPQGKLIYMDIIG